jgi:RNA polymerase sigma-70 factor (ECF subfamily)
MRLNRVLTVEGGRLPAESAREGFVERDPGSHADQDLAFRAVTDRSAFALLYDRYVTRVFRFCYRRLGDRQEAEDATSAIFLRALERIDTYQGGSFGAWLFAIARSTVANRFRDRKLASLDGREEIVDANGLPEDVAIAKADAGAIRALLERLPSDQREVVELRLSGLRGAEIAEAMQRSIPAIKMLQLRAMKRLRSIAEASNVEEY